MLKIIFMGTADFGGSVLEKLADSKENKLMVVTQPDRPQGRGRKILPTPIKKVALSKGLEVFQPEIILVVVYGQILSRHILNVPKLGCINIHGSFLPKYRGAAPINRAIINLSLIHISEPTRLGMISYAVFCLKKKKKINKQYTGVTRHISINPNHITYTHL